jgi:hypothetical protein
LFAQISQADSESRRVALTVYRNDGFGSILQAVRLVFASGFSQHLTVETQDNGGVGMIGAGSFLLYRNCPLEERGGNRVLFLVGIDFTNEASNTSSSGVISNIDQKNPNWNPPKSRVRL